MSTSTMGSGGSESGKSAPTRVRRWRRRSPADQLAAAPTEAPLVIVANRLPVVIAPDGTIERSPGGVASALTSVAGAGTTWIGWPGPDVTMAEPVERDGVRLLPVVLDADELDGYYHGFANSILWPLFHGRLQPPDYDRDWWPYYRSVNHRFATEVAAVAPLGALVWVHDYHLLLVPAMLRSRRPDLRIGLFSHIPFPGQRLFASLPWRKELLVGMADAHLVGFQTDDDAEHFTASVDRLLGSRRPRGEVDVFPISVDVDHWSSLASRAMATPALRDRRPAPFVFLGVDRMDYTKGILHRLEAFGELLDEGRLSAEQCAFVQVAVPSRTAVPAYQAARDAVTELVDGINARHGGAGPAIVLLEENLDEVDLAAWYRAANTIVITSLADGMNLVAKEFVAARSDLDGVVVLSEFAGAADDMPGAVLVNPYDIERVKRALVQATEMSFGERRERMTTMREAVSANDVHDWTTRFLDRLRGRPRTGGTDERPDGPR